MYWKYPILLDFINDRLIEDIYPIYIVSDLVKREEYLPFIKNELLLIGYIIHGTTGLRNDYTMCIFRFDENYLSNKNFKILLEKYKKRCCIIDAFSESWGEKKVILGRNILDKWIKNYLIENSYEKKIMINNTNDFHMKIILSH